MMMGFGSFGGLGIIYMLIFWVVIIGVGVWLLSRIFPRATADVSPRGPLPRNRSSESAQEILKARYARGEITKAEYDEIRSDLGR